MGVWLVVVMVMGAGAHIAVHLIARLDGDDVELDGTIREEG